MRGTKLVTSGVRGGRVLGAWVALGIAVTALGGEAMRESAPSRPKVPLDRSGRPSDPLLERLVNSAPLHAGRDESTFVNPFLTPKPNAGVVDPQVQRQWKRETDRQRNWLLENATQIANPSKAGPGDSERPLPTLRDRLDAESSATVRYLHARDAALATEARRAAAPDPSGLAGRAEVPASAPTLQDQDPRDERPLDTRRITAYGGDPVALASRVPAGASSSGSFAREALPGEAIGIAPGLAEARKTAMDERNTAFESLLESPSSVTPASPAGLATATRDPAAASMDVVGLETRRAPASRARQFDAMLAGGDAGPGALGSMTRALPSASGAPPSGRAAGLPDLGKQPGQGLAVPPPPAGRAPERRFQPQPAILELPRFNQ